MLLRVKRRCAAAIEYRRVNSLLQPAASNPPFPETTHLIPHDHVSPNDWMDTNWGLKEHLPPSLLTAHTSVYTVRLGPSNYQADLATDAITHTGWAGALTEGCDEACEYVGIPFGFVQEKGYIFD